MTSVATLIHDTLFAALRFVSPRFLDDPHACNYTFFSVYICVFLPYACLPLRILSESPYARCFLELLFHHFIYFCVTDIASCMFLHRYECIHIYVTMMNDENAWSWQSCRCPAILLSFSIRGRLPWQRHLDEATPTIHWSVFLSQPASCSQMLSSPASPIISSRNSSEFGSYLRWSFLF